MVRGDIKASVIYCMFKWNKEKEKFEVLPKDLYNNNPQYRYPDATTGLTPLLCVGCGILGIIIILCATLI